MPEIVCALNLRLAETLSRHRRTLAELLASQAGEIKELDEKRARIDELEGLIIGYLRDSHLVVRVIAKVG
jgi:uncharacterized protein (UPF0216 family)